MNRRSFCLTGAAASLYGGGAVKSLQASGRDTGEEADIVFVRGVRYREGNSNAWTLNYAAPAKVQGSIPAVILIHGGGWIRGNKESFDEYCQDFARLGFFAATIGYRLASEAPYPAAIEDCKCAVRWLRAQATQYNVDSERIAALGSSAGGHLALMLGMTDREAGFDGDGPYQNQSSAVQAVVSDSGPVTLQIEASPLLHIPLIQFLAGPPESLSDRIRNGSPLNHISAHLPPLLLIYGTGDGQVRIPYVDDFVLSTQKAGLEDVTYIRLGMVDHCPYRVQKLPYITPLVNAFLKRTLV